MSAANAKLQTQLGIGNAEAANLAKVSARVYANAWGESTADVNEAIKGVYQNIGNVSGAKGGLEGVTTKVMALSEAFDAELGMTTAAVGQLLRTGLAKDADQALDIVAKGLQSGADKAGDFLETLNEYSVQWKRVGLDAQTATGLLAQGLKGGARDADQVADALGQFGERALAGGSAVDAAYKSIGLNAGDVAKMLGKGGDSAKKALQITLDSLRGTKDEQVRLNAAAALFGDPANVMGDALYALDPASAAAATGMDKVKGAAEKAAKTLGSSPASSMEAFKRAVTTQLAEAGGAVASFAMKHTGAFKVLAVVLGVVAGAVITVTAAQKVYAAYTAVATAAETVRQSALYRSVAGYLRLMGVGLMAMARTAAGAVASAATTAAAWVGSALAAVGTFTMAVLRASLSVLMQYARMAARAVIWGAIMAAQWLIAFWPIALIVAAVVALAVLIIANWDKIKAWTLQIWGYVWSFIKSVAGKLVSIFLNFTLPGLIIKHWGSIKSGTIAVWNAVVGWVKGIPGKLVSFFLNWTLPGLIIKHWGRIKSGSIQVASQLVAWVRGLPGRISSGIGSLGSLLYSKGTAVVQGLWNGIKSMGGWIKSQIMGWAKSVIPGPVAKALGISSPSKVTKAQGRWIARGLVDGLTGSAKQVKAAATKVADIVRDSMPKSRKKSKLLDLIADDTRKLTSLANKQASVAAKLKTAQKKVADLIKARDTLAANVKSNILQGADITSMVGEDSARGMGAMNILDGLKKKATDALKFTSLLNALKKKGVAADLVSDIANAGVEGGMASAQALSTASAKQIKDINKQQQILTDAASKAGNAAGSAMYDSGIKAAQGLVKGLQKQQKQIDKQMETIAKSMAKAIRKALGIHSPSTLMANEVGAHVPSGVWQGIKRKSPKLETDLRRWAVDLVRPVREGTAVTSSGGTTPVMGGNGTSAPGRPIVANLCVDAKTLASVLIDPLRGEIQRISGGNVQKALGRGNA
nr:phage tail tape measure protein [Streptomyces sp. SID13726]